MSIKVMTWYWDNSALDGTELLLMLALADWCNDEGFCYPGIKRIAQRCRMSDRGAQKVIKRLQEKDEIVVETSKGLQTKNGNTNRYFLAKYCIASNEYIPKVISQMDTGEQACSPVNKATGEPIRSPLPVNSGSPLPVNKLVHPNHQNNHQNNHQGDTALPQTDEPAPPSEAFPPPSENSPTGDPFMDVALKRFQKRQQNNGRHQANRGGQWPGIDAKVPAAERLPLVERLIDMHGLRAAIDLAQDDGKLADMHKLAADLYVMGFRTLADIETIYQQFQKDWRGKTPAGRQLITIASAMKQTPAQPPKQHTVPPPVIAPDWMTYGIAEENQWKVH